MESESIGSAGHKREERSSENGNIHVIKGDARFPALSLSVEEMRAHPELVTDTVPELLPLIGHPQVSKYHNRDVWEHTLATIEAIDELRPDGDPLLRLAMLLHDIGKPVCFTEDADGGSHFRGHSHAGAGIAADIMARLGYNKDEIDKVFYLIDTHDDNIEPENDENIKHWLDEAGPELMEDVIDVMIADAMGKAPAAEAEWVDIMTRFRKRMHELMAG